MTSLERELQSRLAATPDPDLQVPADLVELLHRRYARRRAVLSMTAVGTIVGVLLAGVITVTARSTPETLSPPATGGSPSGPSTSVPSRGTAPLERPIAVPLPSWVKDSPLPVSPGSARAFKINGAEPVVWVETTSGAIPGGNSPSDPVSVVLYRRSKSQVVTRATAEGVQMDPVWGFPAVHEVPAWPRADQNVWVWAPLPTGTVSIALTLRGSTIATAGALGNVSALLVERPSNPKTDSGTLEALDSHGTVLAHADLYSRS